MELAAAAAQDIYASIQKGVGRDALNKARDRRGCQGKFQAQGSLKFDATELQKKLAEMGKSTLGQRNVLAKRYE